mmetsp:Transcript_43337/g.63599  ORF Transcript_43337/g.63599 Transcript_43337/m.63599 type:complete len:235 (-) Transcript_43337:579-1283(-)
MGVKSTVALALIMEGSSRAVLVSASRGTPKNLAKARANLSLSNLVGASMSNEVLGSSVIRLNKRLLGQVFLLVRSVFLPFLTAVNFWRDILMVFFLPQVSARFLLERVLESKPLWVSSVDICELSAVAPPLMLPLVVERLILLVRCLSLDNPTLRLPTVDRLPTVLLVGYCGELERGTHLTYLNWDLPEPLILRMATPLGSSHSLVSKRVCSSKSGSDLRMIKCCCGCKSGSCS